MKILSLGTLLNNVGGDVVKLRRKLMTRFKDDVEQKQMYLALLDAHEAEEQMKITQLANEIEQRELEYRAKLKAKYTTRYPKVNI